jgi:hypothetical protein
MGGSSLLQISIANGHLSPNTHPFGLFSGEGAGPLSNSFLVSLALGFATGIADIRALVYG